jgi:hypothetical protein
MAGWLAGWMDGWMDGWVRVSGMFLVILTLFYSFTLGGYFVISDIKAVDGQLVFYVSRVLFGFYMNGAPQADAQTRRVTATCRSLGQRLSKPASLNPLPGCVRCAALLCDGTGVIFCMPILFSLEAALVACRVQCFTEAIGKFPNLDSAIEEHIEIWRCIDRYAHNGRRRRRNRKKLKCFDTWQPRGSRCAHADRSSHVTGSQTELLSMMVMMIMMIVVGAGNDGAAAAADATGCRTCGPARSSRRWRARRSAR